MSTTMATGLPDRLLPDEQDPPLPLGTERLHGAKASVRDGAGSDTGGLS